MPRVSAEARAAASWRVGGAHPEPPKHLSRDAKAVWCSIVRARPADYFEPGSLHLLETFCVHTVQLRRVAEVMDREDAGSREHADAVTTSAKLSTSIAQLAQKLRLSIQAATRPEDGRHKERASAAKGRRSLGAMPAGVPQIN